MIKRLHASSGSPYEPQIGFSRAVRMGNVIAVSGTAPVERDGSTSAPGDAYRQAIRCLNIIREAIEQVGGHLENVIRTRVFLTDASVWHCVGKAHGEFFGEVPPVAPSSSSKRFCLQSGW